MRSAATTVEQYLDELPEDRRAAMHALRDAIRNNLPKGFEECMGYGMIGYVVPHSKYPNGYHCDPKLPLPFMNLASQKGFIALYHMGIYGDPKLMEWFTEKFTAVTGKKPDMGKSCIRFKKPEQIPFALIGELAAKMTPDQWIAGYEKMLHRK
ncbi:MAG: DUF1801 domain-containing protein [Chitinophagales bacterium]